MAAGDVDVQISDNRSFGGAFLDGVDDYISLGTSSRLDFPRTQALTWTAWAKTDVTTTDLQLISKFDIAAIKGWSLGLVDATQFRFQLANAAGNRVVADSTLPNFYNFKWHHLAVTYDGSSTVAGVKIYEDGVSLTVDNVVDNLTLTTSTGVNTTIGAMNDASRFWNGVISNVKIYNKVLSATEVTNDFNGLSASGLIHHWKLVNDFTDSGKGLNDTTGIDGTATGSVLIKADSTIQGTVKTQRATTGVNGKFLIFRSQGSQIGTIGITEA